MTEYASKEITGIRIHGVWSCPRLGFMDNFDTVYESLPRLGIPLLRGMGAFWGPALERSIDHIIEREDAPIPDAILCMDYDSVFSYADVLELIRLFKAAPQITAIAAYQWSRTIDKPLFTVSSEGNNSYQSMNWKEMQTDLKLVETAHFGLTMLRVKDYMELKRPRFCEQPNQNMRWEDGKIDEDIWFWKRLQEAGKLAAVAPGIPIGHIESCIVWPGAGKSGFRQYQYEYYEKGKPEAGVFTLKNNRPRKKKSQK